MDGLPSQILPRQIRVHLGHGDSAHAAGRAIVDEFHGPYGTTRGEAQCSALERDEITDLLKESLPTGRATDPSDALWTNSNLVDHPENREIFATLHTGGNKLIVHKVFFLPVVSARDNSSGELFLEKYLVFKDSRELMALKPRGEELGGNGQLRSTSLPQPSDWQQLS